MGAIGYLSTDERPKLGLEEDGLVGYRAPRPDSRADEADGWCQPERVDLDAIGKTPGAWDLDPAQRSPLRVV